MTCAFTYREKPVIPDEIGQIQVRIKRKIFERAIRRSGCSHAHRSPEPRGSFSSSIFRQEHMHLGDKLNHCHVYHRTKGAITAFFGYTEVADSTRNSRDLGVTDDWCYREVS